MLEWSARSHAVSALQPLLVRRGIPQLLALFLRVLLGSLRTLRWCCDELGSCCSPSLREPGLSELRPRLPLEAYTRRSLLLRSGGQGTGLKTPTSCLQGNARRGET